MASTVVHNFYIEPQGTTFFAELQSSVTDSKLYRGGHQGRCRTVAGFTTTCAISSYHH